MKRNDIPDVTYPRTWSNGRSDELLRLMSLPVPQELITV
jgi:hypothetical protein